MLESGHNPEELFNREIDTVLSMNLESIDDQDDLYRLLPGLFPAEIAERLRSRLSSLSRDRVQRILSTFESGDPYRKARLRSGLVVPHALDFEWHFTYQSAQELTYQLVRPGTRSVACVGTPSIYDTLGQLAPRIERFLADRPGVTGHFKAKDHGALAFNFDELPAESGFDVAIVDAPWYPEYALHFTVVAATLCRPGGRVLVIAPPVFTRPGVLGERQSMMSSLRALGIEQICVRERAATYQSPPFEVYTLKALELYGVPHTWRTGDLIEYQLTAPVLPDAIPELLTEDEWEEVRVHRSRIKFRRVPSARTIDPSLRTLFRSDILTSVSRRDPLRNQISVWTSGNRSFECASPFVLRIGFEAFMEGRDPQRACENLLDTPLSGLASRQLHQSIKQLAALVEEEERNLEWY